MLTSEDKRLLALMRDALTAALENNIGPVNPSGVGGEAVQRAADKLYTAIAASPRGLSKMELALKYPTWGRLRFAATDLLLNTNRIIATVSNGRGRPATVYTINPNPKPNPKESQNVNSSAI